MAINGKHGSDSAAFDARFFPSCPDYEKQGNHWRALPTQTREPTPRLAFPADRLPRAAGRQHQPLFFVENRPLAGAARGISKATQFCR